ncbi:MAG: endonuclease/exonuclease/phosphatase family protein [Desulfatiglandales bacterium]
MKPSIKRDPTSPFLIAAVYNIHCCVGRDLPPDPRPIVAVIREMAPDLVALHEVDSRSGKGNELNQALFISEATGLAAVPGPTVFRPDGEYGNVILTRYPVVKKHFLDLSYRGREPRGALDLRLEVRGRKLRVVATHLGLGIRERRYQVDQLLRHLKKEPTFPLVFMGDINEWFPLSRTLRRLNRFLGRSPAPGTFPSFLPLLALDRIWIHPGECLASIGVHKSPLARRASDHLPLKAGIWIR